MILNILYTCTLTKKEETIYSGGREGGREGGGDRKENRICIIYSGCQGVGGRNIRGELN